MVYDNRKTAGYILKGIPQFMLHSYYSQPCKKRSSVNSNTLLLHIALAASGFSCAGA